MGDRCWLRLCWNKADTPKVCKSLGIKEPNNIFSEIEFNDEEVSGVDYEANYAMVDELTKLAEDGVVFHGHHDHGDNYPAGTFCGLDGIYFETATEEAEFTVRVDSTGEVDVQQLAQVRAYIEKHNKAVLYVQAVQPVAG